MGVKKTKSGYSTDAQTLEKLRDAWPEFIVPLLRHREVEKLRGTYGEGLLQEIAADGRIHATFNQTVARTGRLSSDKPNLHNIPVRSDEGRMFRTAFVPSPGRTLLVADYNQIELRCIAHLAHDPGLIEAFTSGQDIHNATASRVFEVEPSKVTLDQRSKAKMVSYGLAYGMEAYGLGQRLNIATEEAAKILDAYFEAFPNVKAYMDATVSEARKNGYTSTLFGRRRPIPELLDSNWRIRQAGERQAMNAGIQGLAADIFKVALVRIDEALEAGGFDSVLVLQVHDEVIVEVPDDERDVVGDKVVVADARRRRARRPARGQRRLGRHLGQRQVVTDSDEADHWFEPVADHLGAAYLRYSFTKGTAQEVEFLVDAARAASRACVCSMSGAGPGATPICSPSAASPCTGSTSATASSSSPARTPRRARRSSGSTPGRCRSTPSSTP